MTTTIKHKAPLTFRHELKHAVNDAEASLLSSRLACLFARDAHAGKQGRYRVTSLYFDTPYDKALREKFEGVDRREKFRLRYYGDDLSFIRLERKIKVNGTCAKQKTRLTYDQAKALMEGECAFLLQTDDVLCLELYAKMRGELLRPRVVVRYEREAYTYAPGNTRITLDRNLHTSMRTLDFLEPGSGRVPAADGLSVLEVKYDEYLPNVVRAVLDPLGRQAHAYSKYALCRRFD